MWNVGNVGNAQTFDETHARNHDTSCSKTPRSFGGILVIRARYYQKPAAQVNNNLANNLACTLASVSF